MTQFIGRPRTCFRLVWVLVFAAFLAISSVTPVSAAQKAAGASSPSGEAAVEKTIGNAGSTETASEDENIYRHTPLVQSLAKTFHLDVEVTARLFEFINFAIVALAIVIPLVRIMPKVIRQRAETLKHDLEVARKMTADAGARLSAVEARLSKLDAEIAAIRAQVEEESKLDEQRIKASIGEESSRIVASAEQEIAAAAAQARRGLRYFVADLAIEQAAQQLVLTPDTDRALIAEFVGDAAKGGLN